MGHEYEIEYVASVDLTLEQLTSLIEILNASEQITFAFSDVHATEKFVDVRELFRIAYANLFELTYGDDSGIPVQNKDA